MFYHVRQPIVEFEGRLIQTGSIEAVNAVFSLMLDELLNGQDVLLKCLVHERKLEMERFSHVISPPMMGTVPAFGGLTKRKTRQLIYHPN